MMREPLIPGERYMFPAGSCDNESWWGKIFHIDGDNRIYWEDGGDIHRTTHGHPWSSLDRKHRYYGERGPVLVEGEVEWE